MTKNILITSSSPEVKSFTSYFIYDEITNVEEYLIEQVCLAAKNNVDIDYVYINYKNFAKLMKELGLKIRFKNNDPKDPCIELDGPKRKFLVFINKKDLND